MPRTTSSEEEGLPSRGDPDRKRVLNVLAQRRYRQRRRERIAALEARANESTSPGNTSASETPPTGDCDDKSPSTLGGVSVAEAWQSDPSFEMQYEPGPSQGTFDQIPVGFDDATLMDNPLRWSDFTSDALNDLPALDQESEFVADTSAEIGVVPVQGAIMQDLVQSTSLTLHAPEVPLYKVMAYSLAVVNMLGCSESIWDTSTRWTLAPLACAGLPLAVQPTPSQTSIPHHPVLDLIPFASVRTKLICFFAMPPELRPLHTRSDTALLDLVHDIEDPSGGFRISGQDGFKEEDWEVGEVFAKNYWWALDREIIQRTNEWRRRRGAGRLLEVG